MRIQQNEIFFSASVSLISTVNLKIMKGPAGAFFKWGGWMLIWWGFFIVDVSK